MAQTSLIVAAGCVDAVRRNVDSLRQVKAESLRYAFVAHLAGERTAVAVHQRARELADVEDLLSALDRGVEATGDVEVEAAETLLRDAIYGAAIDEVETAAELVQGCWRGDHGLSRLERALDLAAALAELLRGMEGVEAQDE